jgi:hypothetical protein
VLGGEELEMWDTIGTMITDVLDASVDETVEAAGQAGWVAPAQLDAGGQQRLAEALVTQARTQGVDLAGPDGLLAQLTKRVLETALEAEMVEENQWGDRGSNPEPTDHETQSHVSPGPYLHP